jgi:hypothetical protein
MADYKDLVGKVISFSLYAPAILGDGYTNVKVIGAVTADIAKTFADIITQHAQVYPSIPPGTVDNYRAYDYLLIENANGNTVPIGFPWIQGTPTESESSITTFTFVNLSAMQVRDLELIVRSNGYSDYSVKVEPV